MIPEPKYHVGQTVWAAEATDEAVQAECPDCAGSKAWKAISPAGDEFSFPCPRCQTQDVWRLRHQKAVASIRSLTIGSVRLDTESRDDKVSYMCSETGVGSGRIWYESRLAATREEAEMLGKFAVADREAWRATEIERTERNRGGPSIKGLLETRLRYHSFVTAEISRADSARYSAEFALEHLVNAVAELDSYGGIEGLDGPTLNRICNHLADTCDGVARAREAVLHDRCKEAKAA